MKKRPLVICPVYNEDGTLREFYKSLREYYDRDVLFINDGSTDKSSTFIRGVEDERTFLVGHTERIGYGSALISGFRFALERGYTSIVTVDADLQHNPEHIPAFLRELSESEVVLGSRYIRIDKYMDVPRERMLINRYIAGLIKLLFSVNISDPFCGYRAYRDSFLRKARLGEKSYGFGLETLLELIRLKVAFKEIPVEAIYVDPSRRFLDGLDAPPSRLLHYLEIISLKKREMAENEKKAS